MGIPRLICLVHSSVTATGRSDSPGEFPLPRKMSTIQPLGQWARPTMPSHSLCHPRGLSQSESCTPKRTVVEIEMIVRLLLHKHAVLTPRLVAMIPWHGSAIAGQAQRTTEVVCTKVPPSFPSSQNSLCLGPINHGLNAAFYWSSACGDCAHTRQWFNRPWTSPMRLQTGSAFDRSNWRTFLGTMLSAR